MNLRNYQEANRKLLLKDNTHYLVEEPTGSGKTVEMVAVAAGLLLKHKRVLVAVPQEHIEEAFTKRSYVRLITPDKRVAIDVPPEMIRAVREDEDGCIDGIKKFLQLPEPPSYALACTHCALTRMRPPTDIPEDLREAVLMVDEAHHVGALGLGQLIDAWLMAGGRLLFWSATGYRADGDPVLRGPMKLLRRILPQHMEEGWAPSRLESEIRPVKLATAASAEEFHGERALESADRALPVILAMIDEWRRDGCPKLIIRVPVLDGGSFGVVSRVIDEFHRFNPSVRVLDATGDDASELMAALTAERDRGYLDSNWDVIVGVQRVREGLDWPLCSTVYSMGLPRHPQTVTQLWGRATRLKSQTGYPAEHKMRAKIVFFVPLMNKEDFADVRAAHARATLLVCSFLANSQCSLDWLLVKHIGNNLAAPLSSQAVTQHVASAYPYLDPVLRADAEAALDDASKILKARGSTAPDWQVVDLAIRRHPELTPAALRQTAIELIAANTGAPGAEVKRRLIQELAEARKDALPEREDIEKAFCQVLDKFEEQTLVDHPALRRLGGELIRLTGRNVIDFARRLAKNRPLTPEWVGSVVLDYHARHQRWPTAASTGGPDNWPDETWAGIDSAIRERKRNWRMVSIGSLAEFVSVFVRHGTLAQQLASFSRDLQIDPQEAAFLNHLLEQTILSANSVIPVGELWALSAAHPEQRSILIEWHSELRRAITQEKLHPLALHYLVELWTNLHNWLNANRIRVLHAQYDTAECSDFTAQVQTQRIRFRVPPQVSARHGNTQFPAGATGYGEFRDTPLRHSLGRKLLGRFNRPIADERTGGGQYYPAAAPVDVYVAGEALADRPDGRSKCVLLPLSWIVAYVNRDDYTLEHSVPRDWGRALRRLRLPPLSSTDSVVA